MQAPRCPRCSRPVGAAEIEGFGILRARAASQGGPRVEFRCPDCGRIVDLVPHGRGRFARPGEPPPPGGNRAAPPWASEPREGVPPPGSERSRTPAGDRDGRAAPQRNRPGGRPHKATEESRAAPPPPPARPEEAEALAILGLSAGASGEEIDRAFRERALGCHPDKAAHLDEDIQRLAAEKFLRLRAAYDRLRKVPG